MKLYIDNREPKKIIDYIISIVNNNFIIEVKTLEIGDFIIYDDINDKILAIIERKSLSDLESSIKDGRYENQSFRLNEYDLHNHNIYYLIEGCIINYKNNNFKNTLYASLVSLSYYKGFSILNSLNEIESCELIVNFVNKLIKNSKRKPYYLNIKNIDSISYDISDDLIIENKFTNNNSIDNNNIKENYEDTIKCKKSSLITKDNINNIMLMQIPKVNSISAQTILEKFNSVENLIKCLKEDNNCLDNLKSNNNRKLGKNIIDNIKYYLVS